jgi:hypothetical protein
VAGGFHKGVFSAGGLAGLFKTASNLYIAGGLILKGLIGYLSMIIHIQSCGVNP